MTVYKKPGPDLAAGRPGANQTLLVDNGGSSIFQPGASAECTRIEKPYAPRECGNLRREFYPFPLGEGLERKLCPLPRNKF